MNLLFTHVRHRSNNCHESAVWINGFCTNSFETFELAHETEERRDAGFVSEKSGAIVPNATVATAQIFAVVFEIKLQR